MQVAPHFKPVFVYKQAMTNTLMRAERSLLLLIDFQARLLPQIDGAAACEANARRLLAAADLLAVPVLVTEQNPEGLGHTAAGLGVAGRTSVAKHTFGSCAAPAFMKAIGTHPDIVVTGCEAHVCVLQTVLGLLDLGRKVFLVRDAVGARRTESKETALARMARHGADIVTTEMVVFEWLRTSEHPNFRAVLQLIK